MLVAEQHQHQQIWITLTKVVKSASELTMISLPTSVSSTWSTDEGDYFARIINLLLFYFEYRYKLLPYLFGHDIFSIKVVCVCVCLCLELALLCPLCVLKQPHHLSSPQLTWCLIHLWCTLLSVSNHIRYIINLFHK